MRKELGLSEEAAFVFVPHLLPVVRGILSTIHVTLREGVGADEIAAALSSAYERAPFLSLRRHGDLPDLKAVVGTPRCDIGFSVLPNGRQAVIVAAIDNL